MLKKPFLALCKNRNQLPKNHPTSGKPEEWFSNENLYKFNLKSISFDFFINWKTEKISNEIWIKRIVLDAIEPWPILNTTTLQKEIYSCDGESNVKALAKFASKYNLNVYYQLFKDENNWDNSKFIVSVKINNNGLVEDVKDNKLNIIQERIRELSGGPVRIGTKGLMYATSTLEGYLSTTDSLWPGDADLVILDNYDSPIALVEYKKHNLDTPISSQQISNYYPRPDGRKYNRLAILKDFMDKNIPFINIYYPTKSNFKTYKIEKVTGKIGQLACEKSIECNLPINTVNYDLVINDFLNFYR